MICKGKEGVDSWQAVAVGDLYIISELCGSWEAMYRWQALWRLASSVAAGKLCGGWQAVAVGKLWQLVICTPLASCVTVGKLCGGWQALWRVAKLCGGWQAVAVGDLYTISELCDSWEAMHRWQALWQLVSCCSWRSVNH
jgi:hypothetical protein